MVWSLQVAAVFSPTVDGCEILRQLIDGKHSMILDGFQPSFWCRISQPSTVAMEHCPFIRDLHIKILIFHGFL
jgi:hypothetical protein